MIVLTLVPIVAAVVFVAAVAVRCIRLIAMPVHLRWELYPVPERRRPGGQNASRAGEAGAGGGVLTMMLPEMVLLKGVYDKNPSLWLRSFPFHLGLYLLGGFAVLLVVGGIAEASGVRVDTSAAGVAGVLSNATTAVGVSGHALLGIGSLLLLLRRAASPALREHSSAASFFNLAAFCVAAGVGLASFSLVDHDFSLLRRFTSAVVTLRPSPELPALVVVQVVLGSALLAYIPVTHMSHFFTKWFMYHDVRWDDEVNRTGSKLESRMRRQLGLRADWAAAHIGGGAQKTWAELASEEPAQK